MSAVTDLLRREARALRASAARLEEQAAKVEQEAEPVAVVAQPTELDRERAAKLERRLRLVGYVERPGR